MHTSTVLQDKLAPGKGINAWQSAVALCNVQPNLQDDIEMLKEIIDNEGQGKTNFGMKWLHIHPNLLEGNKEKFPESIVMDEPTLHREGNRYTPKGQVQAYYTRDHVQTNRCDTMREQSMMFYQEI